MNSTEEGKTVIRKYIPSDKERILQLYEKVWGKEKTERIALIWDWKYHQSPYLKKGDEYHSLVVEKNGSIIGFLGAIPGMIKVGKEKYRGYWLGDFMVDPAHRGRPGIMLVKTVFKVEWLVIGHADDGTTEGAIANKLWQRLKKTKGHITIIENMLKRLSIEKTILKRINIRPLAVFGDRVWRFANELILRLRAGGVRSDMAIEEIERFSQEHKPFLDGFNDQLENAQLKSVEYMNWRFFDRPGTKYIVLLAKRGNEPVGCIVLRILKEGGEMMGRIVDLIAKKEDKECSIFMIKEAEKIFREKKVSYAQVYGTPYFSTQIFKLAGFSNKKCKNPVYPATGECPDEHFNVQKHWHISMSDGDFEMD